MCSLVRTLLRTSRCYPSAIIKRIIPRCYTYSKNTSRRFNSMCMNPYETYDTKTADQKFERKNADHKFERVNDHINDLLKRVNKLELANENNTQSKDKTTFGKQTEDKQTSSLILEPHELLQVGKEENCISLLTRFNAKRITYFCGTKKTKKEYLDTEKGVFKLQTGYFLSQTSTRGEIDRPMTFDNKLIIATNNWLPYLYEKSKQFTLATQK